MVNMISPNATCSWINIHIDPGTTFKSGISLQEMSILALQPELGASTPLLFNHHFPLILGINYV